MRSILVISLIVCSFAVPTFCEKSPLLQGKTLKELAEEYDLNGMAVISTSYTNENIHHRGKRATLSDPSKKWPNAVVNYQLDSSMLADLKKMKTLYMAMRYIEKYTCVRFREDILASNLLYMKTGAQCTYPIGMPATATTDLIFGAGCEQVGTTIKALLSVLGLIPTIQRPDRDDFFIVNHEITREDYKKYNNSQVDTNFFPYEYGSIMHAHPVKDGRLGYLLEVLDQRYLKTMGSRIPSFFDMLMVNRHYNCTGPFGMCNGCSLVSPLCENGGYANPNDCKICTCSYGYGGSYCTERPPGCGETWEATSEWQQQNISIGEDDEDYRYKAMECNYWVTAPSESKILVKLTHVDTGFCYNGCPMAGIEFKTMDKQLVNPRYCCAPSTIEEQPSLLNPMPIYVYNVWSRTNFTIEFRYVNKTTVVNPSYILS